MSSILITGAAGVIGRPTLRHLRQRHPEEEVIGTDLRAYPELGIRKMDVTKFDEVINIVRSIRGREESSVIHLAALVAGPPSEQRPRPYLHVNVMGTLNVLEAMRMSGIPKMIFMSSWSTFGSSPDLPINEETLQEPENPYGVSKVMGELLAQVYSGLYGIEVVVLRPTMIYGPGQPEKNLPQQIVDCMRSGEPFEVWGKGTHTKELLFVEDMAEIIDLALGYEPQDGHEVFVIGTENPLSVVDVAKAGQDIRHFPVKFVPSTKWVFSQRSDMSKARERLGVDPSRFVGIEQGLRFCLEVENSIN